MASLLELNDWTLTGLIVHPLQCNGYVADSLDAEERGVYSNPTLAVAACHLDRVTIRS